MIPLYGFLEGDTIGLLVLAEADDSIAEVARKLQTAARLRAAIDGPVTVIQDGKPVDPAQHGRRGRACSRSRASTCAGGRARELSAGGRRRPACGPAK